MIFFFFLIFFFCVLWNFETRMLSFAILRHYTTTMSASDSEPHAGPTSSSRAPVKTSPLQLHLPIPVNGATKSAKKKQTAVVRVPQYGVLRATSDIDAARQRFHDDGYVYLPAFLSASLIEFFGELTNDRELRKNVTREGGTVFRVATLEETAGDENRALPLEPFQARLLQVPHDPDMMRLIRTLCGGDTFNTHDSHVYFRIKRPSDYTIVHADWSFFVEQHASGQAIPATSDGRFFTVWIPLTPCTPQTTGLLLVPRSHIDYKHAPTTLVPPSFDPDAAASANWAGADFAVGDVVVFDACTIHAAAEKKHTKRSTYGGTAKLPPNRFSFDFRVVPKSFRLKTE